MRRFLYLEDSLPSTLAILVLFSELPPVGKNTAEDLDTALVS